MMLTIQIRNTTTLAHICTISTTSRIDCLYNFRRYVLCILLCVHPVSIAIGGLLWIVARNDWSCVPIIRRGIFVWAIGRWQTCRLEIQTNQYLKQPWLHFKLVMFTESQYVRLEPALVSIPILTMVLVIYGWTLLQSIVAPLVLAFFIGTSHQCN